MALQPFEDRDVNQASMRITNAGDGLSTERDYVELDAR